MTEKKLELRPAKKEDLAALREIWKLTFGDGDEFIDLYFQGRDRLSEMAVLLWGDQVVSMLTMIPVERKDAGGKGQRASMLYAIATHPDFQKQGFAEGLIEYSNQVLQLEQIDTTLLVPAGEDLFRFYRKRGYRDGFFVREAVLSREEMMSLPPDTGMGKAGHSGAEADQASHPDKAAEDCRITSVAPAEYNRLRREGLRGHEYLDYRDDELIFQKNLRKFFDADLLAINVGDSRGCAYYERISQEEVIIKELLIPDRYLAPVLRKLGEMIPCRRFIVRTPPWAGEPLGGRVRAFGMIRENGSPAETGAPAEGADRKVAAAADRRAAAGRPVTAAAHSLDARTGEAEPYLGIAYD